MKSQKYSVSFRVEVKNLSLKDNLVSIIMPIPLQSSYQKLLGRYKITPPVGKIKRETRFQNQYIYWSENLRPKESKTFELKCNVSVKARSEALKSDTNLSVFLRSDKFIDAKSVLRISNELVGNTKDTFEKIKLLNDYVINNLEYGSPIKGLYTIKEALKNDKVDCGGFDVLLASLCIAQKIPTRIICGFFTGYNKNEMHAWLEIFLPNKGWIVADPSIEKLSRERRTKKFAKLGFVGSDRIALSIGHELKLRLAGKYFSLDILQNPQTFVQRGEESIEFSTEFEALRI